MLTAAVTQESETAPDKTEVKDADIAKEDPEAGVLGGEHPLLTAALLTQALGPEPAPRRGAASPRFFHAPVLDWCVRAHPVVPYVLYLPLIAWCLVKAEAQLEVWQVAVGVLIGWFVWTWIEYWLHRGFFHMGLDTPARRVTSYIIHRYHHVAPDDLRRLVAAPLYSGGLFLLLYWVFGGTTTGGGAALLAGSMFGYLVYEAVHYSAHHRTPWTWFGRASRRHHLQHHFATPDANYGISSPLWDFVFRTRRRTSTNPSSAQASASPRPDGEE